MTTKEPDPNALREHIVPLYEDFSPPKSPWRRVLAVVTLVLAIVAMTLVARHWLSAPAAGDFAGELQLAEAAFAAGKYDEAIIHYKNSANLQPENGALRGQLGRVYLHKRNYKLAEKELNKAIQLGVDGMDYQRDLVAAMVGDRDFAGALGKISNLRRKIGNNPTIAILEARALSGLDRRDEARSLLQSIRAIRPDDQVELLIALASVALLDGDSATARIKLDEALALEPAHFEALLQRGAMRSDHGQLIGAETDLRQALAAQPGNFVALAELIDVLIRQGRIDDAKALVAEGGEKFERTLLGHYLQGEIAYLEGDYAVAQAELAPVVEVVPHPQALWALAQIYESSGQFAQAEEALLRLLEVHPGHLPSVKRLARVQLGTQVAARAVMALSPYIEAEDVKADAEFWMLLAEARRATGDISGSAEALGRARAISPNAGLTEAWNAGGKLPQGRTTAAIGELEGLAAPAGGDTPTRAGEQLYQVHMQNGDTAQARAVVQSMLEQPGDEARKYSLLGLTFSAENDRDSARAAFNRALAADPKFAPAYLHLARLDVAGKDFAAARNQLQAAIKADPEFLPAYMGLADLALTRGESAEAVRVLEQAVAAVPTAIEARLALAEQLERGGNRDQAEQLLRDTTATSQDLRAGLALAGLLVRSNRGAEGLKLYEQLAERNPDSVPVLHQWARALHATSQPAAAQKLIMQLLSRDPTDGEALGLGVEIALLDGNAQTALAYSSEYVRGHPDDPRGFVLKGDALSAAGRHAEAAEAYAEANRHHPSSALVTRQGTALLRAGEQDAARRAFDAWLADHPEDEAVRLALASLHEARGELDAAITQYETILQRQPANPYAMNNLAYALFLRGDRRALPMAERARELAPNNPQIGDTLGWILLKNGELERGLSELERALDAAPTDPYIRYHYARALAANGRQAEARIAVTAALAAGTEFAERADAEALLRELGAE